VALLTGWGHSLDVDETDDTIVGVVSKPVTGETLRRLLASIESRD
jgi:hypothetical protein